ncbi:hypothetical protein [Winogradskyella poriferorum]|uniref:hypothetical protein n=1 Tax=Winogradskyella poriferorum TaxID=307627 RepID=UPI003D655E25
MPTAQIFTHILELLAALAASYYWVRTKDRTVRYFVYYLWFIVLVETLGMYPYLYDLTDNAFIQKIANSKMRHNYWLYSFYNPTTVFLIGRFLIDNMRNKTIHIIIRSLSLGYIIFAISYFLYTGTFFEQSLPYDIVVSTFIIFLMVLLYLRELMDSEKILSFYKSPILMVLIVLTLWYICITPLFIYEKHFVTNNPSFIAFHYFFIGTANIILYSWYIFAFLFSLRYKMRLVTK